MREFGQRRTDGDDESVEAEFWGGTESVRARVAMKLVLIGSVAGIVGLSWLGGRLF